MSKGNDWIWWVVIAVLLWMAWPQLPASVERMQAVGSVLAQPAQAQRVQMQALPPAQPQMPVSQPTAQRTPPTDCIAAVRTVPAGWEEGLGGPTPICWDWWDESQRLEFLNYVKRQAHP